jgi:hypothetical protein
MIEKHLPPLSGSTKKFLPQFQGRTEPQ